MLRHLHSSTIFALSASRSWSRATWQASSPAVPASALIVRFCRSVASERSNCANSGGTAGLRLSTRCCGRRRPSPSVHWPQPPATQSDRCRRRRESATPQRRAPWCRRRTHAPWRRRPAARSAPEQYRTAGATGPRWQRPVRLPRSARVRGWPIATASAGLVGPAIRVNVTVAVVLTDSVDPRRAPRYAT
jgi:hypothetical protein